MSGLFDVFLSHNSKDKPAVRQLAQALQKRDLQVWLDELQLQPGLPWQDALEEIIQTTNSAAVLVGRDGLGPWEILEMRSCLLEFVERKLPVIPVLLPSAPSQPPKLPLLLKGFTWVDLRGGLTKDGLDQLEWGITGVKPGQLLGGAKGWLNRLQKKISELRLIWTEYGQKMINLRRDLISAIHLDERLRIQKLIDTAKAEREQIEQELDELESQIASLSVPYVILIEFVLDQPLESFDQNEFKDVLKRSIDMDVSKARIVSIHQASIFVRFKADEPEEGLILDSIVDTLALSSKEKVSKSLIKFTQLTKMKMMKWINRGKQYELQLRDDLKSVTIREKHDPDPYKMYIELKY